MNVGNVSGFNTVTTLKVWVSHVLPLVYDDTLSFMELLGKVTYKLNELIENNNKLPDYIADLIREYISSGEIEKVLAEVLANYMLNVKFPPAGLTPATGDGSADDTEAIQGCIDYAFNHGGMAIYFPSGSYLTQPLVLKNKCTMFGYDRYNTRLVLKGSATTAMFTGNVDELTLTGMGFDGNMDIQVNNVNLFDVTVGSAIITNVLLTDGYDLLKVVVNRDLQLDDVIFNHAVENGLVVSGNGYVQADNVIFKSVSALIGKNYVVLGCNDSILTKVKCEGASPNGVRITGNNNVVKMWNEGSTTAYVDEGQNNSVEVYTVSDVQKFSGSVEKHVSGTVTNTAGSNISETVGGKKTVQTVKGYEEIIGAGKTVNVTGNFDEVVSGDKGETAMNINDTSVAGRTENTGTNKTVIVKGNDSEDITGTKVTTVTGKTTENANGGKVINTTVLEENLNSKVIKGDSVIETLTGNKTVTSANTTENVSGDKTVNAGDVTETSNNHYIHAKEDFTEQVDGDKNETITGTKVTTVTGKTTENANGGKVINTTVLEENISGVNSTNASEFNVVSPITKFKSNSFNVEFPDVTVDLHKLIYAMKDVRYYGAVGDGETNDTSAFQASLDAQGCAIVPVGTFKCNVLLKSNQSIIGLGESSTLIPQSAEDDIIYSKKSFGCTIIGLHIKGEKTGNGVHMEKCDGFVLDNLYVENCANGIYVNGKTPGYGRLTHINNCYIYTCNTCGLFVDSYSDLCMYGVECVSCSGIGQNQGYNCLIQFGAFKMVNCHFWNQNDDYGFYRPNTSLRVSNCPDFEITNCHFEGGYSYNLLLDKSSGYLTNCLIYATFGAYSVRYDTEYVVFTNCSFSGQAVDNVDYKPPFKSVFSLGGTASYTVLNGCVFNAQMFDPTTNKPIYWQIVNCINNNNFDLANQIGETNYVSCIGFDSSIRYTNVDVLFYSQDVRLGTMSLLNVDTTLTGEWYPGCKHYVYNTSGAPITITTNYKSEKTFTVESYKLVLLIADATSVYQMG